MQLDPNNVRTKMCKSCPFGARGVASIRKNVEERCMTQANQICHTSEQEVFEGKRQDLQVCRGARNYQLRRFHELGVLKDPTDQAWAQALKGKK